MWEPQEYFCDFIRHFPSPGHATNHPSLPPRLVRDGVKHVLVTESAATFISSDHFIGPIPHTLALLLSSHSPSKKGKSTLSERHVGLETALSMQRPVQKDQVLS
jgi:hypothetical protein